MNEIQRHMESIEHPTLILIDMEFFGSEFLHYRSFYADLYSGENPDLPQKVIPEEIDEVLLLDALCKYGHARADIAKPIIFDKTSAPTLFKEGEPRMMNVVHYSAHPWREMTKAVLAQPDIKRVLLVADNLRYQPFVEMLRQKSYSVCLIKHKQEDLSDLSQMPPDLPYQFTYYVVGEILGLSQYEL